jgi:hypothetical protein
LAREWSKDLLFVLANLSSVGCQAASDSATCRAIGSIDETRVGALGHSLGGAASLQAALESSRIKASLNLDGRLLGDVPAQGVNVPTMVLLNETHLLDGDDPTLRQYLDNARGTIYYAWIKGTMHNDFSDLGTIAALMSDIGHPIEPSKYLLGGIDSARSLAIQSAYVRAFFGSALEGKDGKDSDLLQTNSPEFPELTLMVQ